MTEQTASQYRTARQHQEAPPRGATGLVVFAGMMIMAGGFRIFHGLVALLAVLVAWALAAHGRDIRI